MTTTPRINIIAAINADTRAIGRRGDMLHHLRDDLRRFRALTLGHPIVMGRKTFESLPAGALPGRRNLVVSRNSAYAAPGAEVFPTLDAAIAACDGNDDIFIIGGAEIYRLAMPLARRLFLTVIDHPTPPDADTFFPAIDPCQWQTTDTDATLTDAATGIPFHYVCMTRK